MRRLAGVLACVVSFCGTGFGAGGAKGGPGDAAGSSGQPPILSERSAWRSFFVWQTEMVESDKGELSVRPVQTKTGPVQEEKVTSPPPPPGWKAAEFDDSAWAPSPGPITMRPQRRDLAAIFLRGRFQVDDPAGAGQLALSLRYRGGAVVYLNGREVARGDMPDGEVAADGFAKGYPKDSYVDDAGTLLNQPANISRTLSVTLPAAELRKGINLLAVELHRAPTSALLYDAPSTVKDSWKRPMWSLLAFEGLELLAPAGSPVSAVAARPGRPVAWAGSPVVDGWDSEPAEQSLKPAPVIIAGARNGAFSGVAYVQSAEAVRNIKVDVSDLREGSGGAIPGVACQVRYGIAGDTAPVGGAGRHAQKAVFLGALEEDPPAEVALPPGAPTVTIPVWLTVRVPADAKPGEYSGSVAVSVNGGGAVSVPVALSVADFLLPDPKAFRSYPDLVESPESVALKYGVPLWSEEHWKLLDRAFALLGQIGAKEVLIPLIGRTNMGNEHSMVRRIRKDGAEELDFSVAERYLDLAVRHLGKLPVVILYVWTPTFGGGGFGKIEERAKNDVPMMFTVYDPATKEMKLETGPDWGTPESKPFWKPVIEGMRKVLAARGLEGSIAYGLVNDRVPSKSALDDLNDSGADIRWAMYAHGRCAAWAGRPLAVDCCVWGTGGPRLIGEQNHKYSWKNKPPTTVFPRFGAGILNHVRSDSPLGVYQMQIEAYAAAGYNGVGNVGADFWPVVKDKKGELRGTVMSRFQTWQRPGEPTMSNGAYLFPGAKGPIATARFELFRMGVQETEARIAIEMALDDKAKAGKLGADLAERAKALLNDRARRVIKARDDNGEGAGWLDYAAGWQSRTLDLYRMAGEVSRKLGE